MNTHRHLSSEEIFERVSMGETTEGIAGCASCEAEASSLSGFLVELKRCDSELAVTTDWDDLLARKRIREAVAREKPHSRTIFDRFFILRPAFVSAVAASVALAVWSPLSQDADKGKQTASASPVGGERIPSWTPLPDESEDEGLAVLAEWTPNEDEVSIARCHFACLSGLSDHEEENLLRSVATITSRSPLTEASPL